MAAGRFLNYQNDPQGLIGQLAQYANSASPAAAVLSNTTPSYATLGGKFNFAAPAGAETDFALFGWQNNVIAAQNQARLFIEGISIALVNIGAAVATTATVVEWGVGINSTAASLATVDAGPGGLVFGPRRLALGTQAFVVGAAIGQQSTDIVRSFVSSLVVEPGRFLHIICRIPIGTATVSQVLRGSITIDGYFGN